VVGIPVNFAILRFARVVGLWRRQNGVFLPIFFTLLYLRGLHCSQGFMPI
jgi:hypothetical protein